MKTVGVHISLRDEKKFRSDVASCNKSLAAMKSELNLVGAQTYGTANKLETLEKKQKILSKIVGEHTEKEEKLRKILNEATDDYEKVGKQLEEYKKELKTAQKELEAMEQRSDTTKEALDEQRAVVHRLTDIVDKGTATYQKAEDRVNNWKKQLNNAEAQTIKATKALQQNEVYLHEAEKSWKDTAKSIDEFGKETEDLVKKLTKTGTAIKVNLTNSAIEAGKAMVSEAASGALELEAAQTKLAASTGLTAEEMQAYTDEIEELYKTGYGDAVADIADNMALVKQYTGEVDPTKIKELTENAMALDDTFSNMDISETLRGVDALMKNMGLTAEEAFDYITVGAQNGLNKSGELTDNIAEYTQLWSQAGFSATEMFSILDNGLSSGAYNLDKVNDFVKEFGNSLADGRIESSISSFSTGTQDLFYQWKAGEATTRDVFYSVISDLEKMTNQQTALTIASNTWSALGEDNAMAVITALNDLNGTYTDVHGSMEELKKVRYDNVISQYKQLGRTLQTDAIQPVLTEWLPAMKWVTKVATENATAIAGVGAVVGTAYGVNKIVKFTKELNVSREAIARHADVVKKGVKNVFEWIAAKKAGTAATITNTVAEEANTAATVGQEAATISATVAQNGLNLAMLANPAVLVTAGIAGLCTAILVLGKDSETVATKTNELCANVDELNDGVREASEGLKESCEGINEGLTSIEAKEGAANSLIQELYELDGASSKTQAQINRMVTIVGELNSMFPDLSLSIDENTGALNKNEQQTQKSVETSIKYAKVQAAQEELKKVAEELTKADIARFKAEKNVEEIGKEIAEQEKKRGEIEKKLQEAASGNVDATEDQVAVMQYYEGQLVDVDRELDKLRNAQEEQQEGIEGLNANYEQANELYATTCEYIQGLTSATEDNTEKTAEKNEQSEASIELAGQELDAYNNLAAGQRELATSVTNGILEMQANVQSSLESQMDMFEEFDGGVEISSQKLLSNMQSQIDGVANWEKNLSELADKGINQGILQKLAAMGPEGSGYVSAFNSMTTEEIAKANELWDQSLDVKGMTDIWGQQLTESGAANIAGGMENLTGLMEESGANTVQGLINGMQEAQKQAEIVGKDIGVKTVDSVNEGLGCQSPSKKTKESGKNTDLGLVNGLKENKSFVTGAAKDVAESVIETVNKTISMDQMKGYGKNTSHSFALGIKEGKSEVVRAATEVAAAAITATKEKLDIHSPSKVFRGIGNNTMESYALGTKEKKKYVAETVADTLNFEDYSGKLRNNNSASQMDANAIARICKEMMQNVTLKAFLNGREVTRELSRLGVCFNA